MIEDFNVYNMCRKINIILHITKNICRYIELRILAIINDTYLGCKCHFELNCFPETVCAGKSVLYLTTQLIW